MKHWSEVFGNLVSAEEIWEDAVFYNLPIKIFLKERYQELCNENPEFDPEQTATDNDFRFWADQVIQECQ